MTTNGHSIAPKELAPHYRETRVRLFNSQQSIADLRVEVAALRKEIALMRTILAGNGYSLPQGIILSPEPPTHKVTIARIKKVVSDFYKIHISEIDSARRDARVLLPRHVAIYLTQKLTPRSMSGIGRLFGDRDHTTIISAIKRIDALRKIDAALNQQIFAFESELIAND